uniref:SOWAHA-C winged helix-turn-helix domain-containing protein n=1 Tax=Esox lucius TaxID=8010 RepID=A0A3P8Z735_ESOLU
MALTQETILTFLLEHGGKVKNSELLNNYKHQINCSDPAEKKHNRDVFKSIINSIAFVKQIDDIKFVVVKNRYQDFLKREIHIKSHKSVLEDSLWSPNTSFSPSSLERSGFSSSSNSGKILTTDIENNNTYCASVINGNDEVKNISLHSEYISARESGGCPNAHSVGFGSSGRSTWPNNAPQETPTIKVLNVSADQGINKSGKATDPLFAIVAVKFPLHSLREDSVPVRQDGFHSKVYFGQKTSEIQRSHAHLQPEPVLTPKHPGRESLAWGRATYTSPGAKIRYPELGEMPQTSGSPQLKKTPNELQKQGDNAKCANKYSPSQSLQLKRTLSKHTKQGDDITNVPANQAKKDWDKFSDQSVPMETAAHEWLVKSAAGLWGQLDRLLLQDPQLAQTKDFISGFTALHWAAKGGNTRMVRSILDVSRKRGVELDVNRKTRAGYTALHVAAIHGRHAVIALLVRDYGASVDLRDNDGKKPYHYLEKGTSWKISELLGDPHATQPDRGQERAEDGEHRELPRGLNTLSKLMGQRRRYRQHNGEEVEESRDVPQPYHRRNFSDMFHPH